MSGFFDDDWISSADDGDTTDNDSASDANDTGVNSHDLVSQASLTTDPCADPFTIREFLERTRPHNTDDTRTRPPKQVTSRPRYQLNPTLGTEAKDGNYIPVPPFPKSFTSGSATLTASSSKPLSITSSRGNSYSLVSTSSPSQLPSKFPTSNTHDCGANGDTNAEYSNPNPSSKDATNWTTSTSNPSDTITANSGSCDGTDSSIRKWIDLRTIREQKAIEQHRTRLALSLIASSNDNGHNNNDVYDSNELNHARLGDKDVDKHPEDEDEQDEEHQHSDPNFHPNESALNMVRARFIGGDRITDDSISAILELTHNDIESTVEFLSWGWQTRSGYESTLLTSPTATIMRSSHATPNPTISALSTTHRRQQTTNFPSLATALGITSASSASTTPPPGMHLQSPSLPTHSRPHTHLSASRTERVRRHATSVTRTRRRQSLPDQRQPQEDVRHHCDYDNPHPNQEQDHHCDHRPRNLRRQILSEPDHDGMAGEEDVMDQYRHQHQYGRDQHDTSVAAASRQRTSLSHSSPHPFTVSRHSTNHVPSRLRLTFDDSDNLSVWSSELSLSVEDLHQMRVVRPLVRDFGAPDTDVVDVDGDHSFVDSRVGTSPRRRMTATRTIHLDTDSSDDDSDVNNLPRLPDVSTRQSTLQHLEIPSQQRNQQLDRDAIAHPFPSPPPSSSLSLSPSSSRSAQWQRRLGNVRRKLFRTNRRQSATSVGDLMRESMFRCPITQEVMKDAVMTADGHSYDESAIKTWLQFNFTSPLTNAVLPNKHLTPNFALRHAIDEWQRYAKTTSTKLERLESKLSNLQIKNEILERKLDKEPSVLMKIRNKIKKKHSPKPKNNR
eukprot:m.230604 g.230604  ORF g.230604 m.230604 type:complete len:840 (-) comp33584_c0_seq2:486-3005(-)